MFERYTEKARRTIFFGRYEASQFGSAYIETEHLLLGLLREDRALANRYLRSFGAAESIRKRIERETVRREKVPASVDLPLSRACTRALTYGAEEAERLNHRHIGTEHLLLGLLREEKCFAAELLGEQGLSVDSVRKQMQEDEPQRKEPVAEGGSVAKFARLDEWLAECEARGGVCVVRRKRGAKRALQFALYRLDPVKGSEESEGIPAAAKLAQIQSQIDVAVERMEAAIASHDFEGARLSSNEEREQRENLRLLREQFQLEETPLEAPILSVEIMGDERFAEVQQRCDECMAEGVAEIWLLNRDLRRAYTVTKAEGLREYRGGVLQMAQPPLEMDLKRMFD